MVTSLQQIQIAIYFLSFSSPNFVTVFISWLNLDTGFDICFFKGMDKYDKVQIQLVFPIYIIFLVIIVIILSECSTKFARIVGKGNPIAVLTTMILLSYTKFFNVVIGSISLLYSKPAYGSRNLNITRFDHFKQTHPESFELDKKHYSKILVDICTNIGILYTSIVFFWPWLLNHQNRYIFRWVSFNTSWSLTTPLMPQNIATGLVCCYLCELCCTLNES